MENTAIPQQESFTVPRLDIHDLITHIIIQQLEAGTIPWQKPWTGGENKLLSLPRNFITGNKYRGINILLLWCSSLKNNFQSEEWGSFKQWQQKKESIRKGEKGNLVVYYDTIERETDGEIKKIPFLKSSYVFNRCQLTSYVTPERLENPHVECLAEVIEPVEEFICNTKVIVEHRDQGACYIPSMDKIIMPYSDCFKNTTSCTATEAYYSTLLHELTHWTGNKDRLNRNWGKKFGDRNYANEELVAEFGAAFLCAGFGIATLEKGDHAAYIDHWIKVLKENKHCLTSAASEASKAVDYLNSLQPV